jgi:hypothetical protein
VHGIALFVAAVVVAQSEAIAGICDVGFMLVALAGVDVEEGEGPVFEGVEDVFRV